MINKVDADHWQIADHRPTLKDLHSAGGTLWSV